MTQEISVGTWSEEFQGTGDIPKHIKALTSKILQLPVNEREIISDALYDSYLYDESSHFRATVKSQDAAAQKRFDEYRKNPNTKTYTLEESRNIAKEAFQKKQTSL